jgi:hypothetical protein
MKNKSDLKGKVRTLLTGLKIAGLNVKLIRFYDAGENMKMKNDPEIKSAGIKIVYSCSRTPKKMET